MKDFSIVFTIFFLIIFGILLMWSAIKKKVVDDKEENRDFQPEDYMEFRETLIKRVNSEGELVDREMISYHLSNETNEKSVN